MTQWDNGLAQACEASTAAVTAWTFQWLEAPSQAADEVLVGNLTT